MQQKLIGGCFTVSFQLVSKITSVIGSIFVIEANVLHDTHTETGNILAFQARL